MDSLVKLLEAVLALRRTAGRIRIVVQRGMLALGLSLFAVLLSLAGIGCLTASLWIYALPLLGPGGTPAAVAGIFIVASIALLCAARRLGRPIGPERSTVTPDGGVDAEVARLLGEHKTTVLFTAFLAGLNAGLKERR